MRPADPKERLLTRVRVGSWEECWPFTTQLASRYPAFVHNGLRHSVSRWAYHLLGGSPLPPSHLEVCHTCDNTRCVNPSHLFLGTHAENMADRNAKGRQARGDQMKAKGEGNGMAKLTQADIVAIRAASGPQSAIGRQFGISQGHVSSIKSGDRWGHL